MISVYQLVDALPAALFGMFALWAAGSQRHWFLRTAVVGGVVLVLLFVPAYEAMIEFAIQAVLVAAGVSSWRRRRKRSSRDQDSRPLDRSFLPHFSLKDSLLFV